MKMRLATRIMVAAILLAALTGCASAPKPKERFFWPRPPETPRIEWLGTYWGIKEMGVKGVSALLETEEPIDLQMPLYVASDGEGRVFVGDQKRPGVVLFDFNKKKVILLSQDSPDRITSPTGLALDANGNLYAADGKLNTVTVYNRDNNVIKQLSLAQHVTSIGSTAIDKKRNTLIVPDIRGHKVAIFDLNGNFLSSFGKRGLEDGDFLFPTSVAVDQEGNIFVCDSQNARIQKFSSDGKFLMKFGTRGDRPGNFAMIKAVALDSEGHIYVTDGKLHNFSIYSATGEYLLAVGGQYSFDGRRTMPGGFFVAQGIYIDKNDTIYVTDQMNGRLQVFQYLNPQYLQKHPASEGVAPVEVEEPKEQQKKKKK